MAIQVASAERQRDQDGWKTITALVLDGISSRHTHRAYSQALDEFLIWFRDDPGRVFNKAAVQRYRTELKPKDWRLPASTSAYPPSAAWHSKLADNGLMAPELAAGIARAKGAKRSGVRLGHWLTAEQVADLLAAPDLTTIKGIRDGAVLALLVGAGLRRSELAALNCDHFQFREGRWLIADLVGKQGRIRSVPIPRWAYRAVTRWVVAAGITEERSFEGLPVTVR